MTAAVTTTTWRRPWPVAFLVDERESKLTAVAGERSRGRVDEDTRDSERTKDLDWIHDDVVVVDPSMNSSAVPGQAHIYDESQPIRHTLAYIYRRVHNTII
jgi:hypothetical protein